MKYEQKKKILKNPNRNLFLKCFDNMFDLKNKQMISLFNALQINNINSVLKSDEKAEKKHSNRLMDRIFFKNLIIGIESLSTSNKTTKISTIFCSVAF